METHFVAARRNPDLARERLERALGDHHGATLEELSSVSRELGRGLPVFIAGSLIEGLANRYSDADLFAIDVDAPARGRPCWQADGHVGSLRLDLEAWSLADLTRMAADFPHAAYLGTLQNVVSEPTLKAAYRLASGFALVRPDAVEEAQRAIDLELFQIYVIRQRRSLAINALADAIGGYRSGDLDYALLRAREALNLSLEGTLALAGDTSPNGKFVFNRLKARFGEGDALVEAFVGAHSEWPKDRTRLAATVEEIIRMAKTQLDVAMKTLWSSPRTTADERSVTS